MKYLRTSLGVVAAGVVATAITLSVASASEDGGDRGPSARAETSTDGQPDTPEPGATEPGATEPGATKPGAARPDSTAPRSTAPDAPGPDATAPDGKAPDSKAPDSKAAPADPTSTGTTYADFSRLTERSAGQFGSKDSVAGQWSWRTDGPGHYSITWDQERPENREHFFRSEDGEWLLLDGWGARGVEYYEQRVTSETVGDADCSNMQPLPSEGDRQHYVRWNIPAEGYCLDARGTITEESGGPEITFRHRQVWSPPAPCANATFPDRMCITQHETWWDDNGHPYEKTLDRKIQIAQGLGMAFTINQSFPEPWTSELVNVWDY